MLEKIYRALKPGGLFIFDVFTDKNRGENDLGRSWNVAKEEGFWSPDPYLAMNETFLYPEENTLLEQTIVMTEDDEIKIHRNFNHFYTKQTVTVLLDKFALKITTILLILLVGNIILNHLPLQ